MLEQLPSVCKAEFEIEVTHFLDVFKDYLVGYYKGNRRESGQAVILVCTADTIEYECCTYLLG